MKSADRPIFGNLSELKVISSSSVIAGPFICGLFAEQGADVIQIESPKISDMLRKLEDRNNGKTITWKRSNCSSE